MATAVVLTTVQLPNGVTHVGHALCARHLADRLNDNTILIKDGVFTSQFECDDCKAEVACQPSKNG